MTIHFPKIKDIELIAENEKNIIYSGISEISEKPVVIKTLNKDHPTPLELARFKHEYSILSQLDSPYIIKALDIQKHNNIAYIVLEHGGKSLSQYVGRFELTEFLILSIQLSKALGALHHSNIIHKDIKPSNILISPDMKNVKLIDFGIATTLTKEKQNVSNREISGSLQYLSPEQTGRMNRSMDYRTDFYSLGITLFQVITGKLPFHAETTMEWLYQHISKTPIRPESLQPKIPQIIGDMILKLMSKNAEDRYQTAAGLQHDLERCLHFLVKGETPPRYSLGEQDHSSEFKIPQKLYGREKELETLVEHFYKAANGQTSLLFVRGYSGIGKSALIHEVHKPITKKGGLFAEGKYDQYTRNMPFYGIVQALNSIISEILTENDKSLELWKNRFQNALGGNGKIIDELVPTFSRLMGPLPDVEILDSEQSKNRLYNTMKSFLNCIATEDHPLVLFIDDLQWCDVSTLDLLKTWGQEITKSHFLFIGSYRSNEVDNGHPLHTTLEELRRDCKLGEIEILPLAQNAIEELILDTLNLNQQDTKQLSEIVYQKAKGNPFFTEKFLMHLVDKKHIFFDPTSSKWEVDFSACKQTHVSDNVVDFLVGKLSDLSPSALSILKLAACLGHSIDFHTIKVISELAIEDLKKGFWEILDFEFLIPLNDNYNYMEAEGVDASIPITYKFQHDRIQQAAYQLIDNDKRMEFHLQIGRQLLKNLNHSKESASPHILRHFNLALSLIRDEAEIHTVMKMNYHLGIKAFQASSYEVAQYHFEIFEKYVSPEKWKSDYDQIYEYHIHHMIVCYIFLQFEKGDALFNEITTYARTNLEKAYACKQKINQYTHHSKTMEAIDIGVQGLAFMGVKITKGINLFRTINLFFKIQRIIKKTNIESLIDAPLCEDKNKIMISETISEMVPALYMSGNYPLYMHLSLFNAYLSLRYGIMKTTTPYTLAVYGLMSILLFKKWELGYSFGKLALNIANKYDLPMQKGRAGFIQFTSIMPWKEHMSNGVKVGKKALEASQSSGDQLYYSYTAMQLTILDPSLNLLETVEKEAPFIAALNRKNQRIGAANNLWLEFHKHLLSRGNPKLPFYDLKELDLSEKQFKETASMVKLLQLELYFYYNETTEALKIIEEIEANRSRLVGLPLTHKAGFLPFFIYAKTLPTLPSNSKLYKKYLKRMKRDIKLTTQWANLCPENFGFMPKLMMAELKKHEKDFLKAVELFKEAIKLSKISGWLNYEAFANEQFGRFYEAYDPDVAEKYFVHAYRAYQSWGAETKLKLMKEEWPHIQFDTLNVGSPTLRATISSEIGSTHSTINTTSTMMTQGYMQVTLDMDSIIRSTQAIGREVKLDKIVREGMKHLQVNAGSTSSMLLLVSQLDDEKLFIEAEIAAEQEPQILLHKSPNSKDLPMSVINFVSRTQNSVILGQAKEEGSYKNDPYIANEPVKSICCLPILNQNQLIGILYLENRVATQAFTNHHVKVAEIISSQLSVSIKNAKLYENLEKMVEERTQQLSQKNKDIQSMLQNMKQGIFTIDSNGKIHHEYSSFLEKIIEEKNIAGRSVSDLILNKSNLSANEKDQIENTLAFSMGEIADNFEVNAHNLPSDLTLVSHFSKPKILSLDWDAILSEDPLPMVQRIMVSVRDVTELRELQKEAKTNQEELLMISEILQNEPLALEKFAKNFTQSLQQIDKFLASSYDVEFHKEILRYLHTMKGNARTLGLSALSSACHITESHFLQYKSQSDTDNKNSSVESLHFMINEFEKYENIRKNKLSSFGNAGEIPLKIHKTLSALVDDKSNFFEPKVEETYQQLLALVKTKHDYSLGDIVKPLIRSIQSISKELDKVYPEIEMGASQVKIPSEYVQLLNDVFLHCFRNSLDHGIESPNDRVMKGKPEKGRIFVQCLQVENQIHVEIKDDGRGLNLVKIKMVAKMKKLLSDENISDEELANFIFHSGFSTAATITQISGRGIGMDVVKAFLEEVGGDIQIVFENVKSEEGFRPFKFLISLPLIPIRDLKKVA